MKTRKNNVTFDLNKALRTPAIRNRYQRIQREVALLQRGVKDGKHQPREVFSYILKSVAQSGWNFGFFVPMLFPEFENKRPLYLSDRPFMYAFLAYCVGLQLIQRAGRQVGKSSGLIVRTSVFTNMIPGHRVMYVAPHNEHVATYAKRFRAMERAFVYPPNLGKNKEFTNNQKFKEYANESSFTALHILTDSGPARGKTADELNFDEYQHMDPSLEPDIEQVLKSSDHPAKVYSGTSTTVDSPLEVRFQESSAGIWMMRSRRKGKWINLNDPEQVRPIIKPEGLTCPYSGQLLDPARGEFVHQFPERIAERRVGFHTPQIIVPDYVTDRVKWNQIYKDFQGYDDEKFMEEVMGIPTRVGSGELSENDIKRMCMEEYSSNDLQQMALSKKRYVDIVAGLDYGGSDNNRMSRNKKSYTVLALAGILPNKDMEVFYIERYPGSSYRDILSSIVKTLSKFSVKIVGSDYGVGFYYNEMLRDTGALPPEKHFIFHYGHAAVISEPKGEDAQGLFNRWMLNKSESLSALFGEVTKMEPTIRCFRYQEAKTYLEDLLHINRVVTERPSGRKNFLYQRNLSKSDDVAHAINFCNVLRRLINGEELMEDRVTRQKIRDRLGFDIYSKKRNIADVGGGYMSL